MFDTGTTLESLNKMCQNTMMEHLGIVFTEIGADYVKATMPVDHRHHQPYGLLHGGASVSLAESLGSVAAHMTVDSEKFHTVGLEINANHIRSVRSGIVTGIARPLHTGKSTQVWEIRITNEQDQLTCVSRLTVAIISV